MNNMSTPLIIIMIYIIGYMLSVLLMYIFKDKLNMHSFSEEFEESNINVYAAFSLFWPIFWYNVISEYFFKKK
jgi:hypothetical protein